MDRRQFLFRSSLFATYTLLPLKQGLSYPAAGTFSELRRNVGFFTGRGGTIGWLVTPDAFVVVDAQYPESANECYNGLDKKTGHNMDLLINTHHHGDHTNGNIVFREYADRILAHENVPTLMKQAYGDGDRELAYPNETYTESTQVDAGDETVHVTYYGRAHTSGDSVIYFERANVVHMGDLVFNRMNPYTDRPAGASIHHWVEVLDSIIGEYPSDAIYIFGHGREEFGVTGTKEDVKVMGNYLSALIDHVDSGIEAGKSKEEIIDKKIMDQFPDFQYADWWTLSQNLEVVYNEITEDRN